MELIVELGGPPIDLEISKPAHSERSHPEKRLAPGP
jgi:hypothetical protein